jgi:hypothetical protein
MATARRRYSSLKASAVPFLIVASLSGFASRAAAVTYSVPTQFPSVQVALESGLAAGDQIHLLDGHVDPGFTVSGSSPAGLRIYALPGGTARVAGSIIVSNHNGPLTLEGLSVTNAAGVGISISQQSDNVTVKRCAVSNCGGNGIEVEGTSGINDYYPANSYFTSISIEDSEIRNNAGNGVYVNFLSSVGLYRCNISNNGRAGVRGDYHSIIDLVGGHNADPNVGKIESNGANGVHLTFRTTAKIQDAALSGNVGVGIYAYGVRPFGCEASLPELPPGAPASSKEVEPLTIGGPLSSNGNTITGSDTAIQLENRSEARLIGNNTISGCNTGIWAHQRSNVETTIGNQISNDGPGGVYGVRFMQQSFGRLESNTITGFTTTAGLDVEMMDFGDPDPVGGGQGPSCYWDVTWPIQPGPVTLENNTIGGSLAEKMNRVNILMDKKADVRMLGGNSVTYATEAGLSASEKSQLDVSGSDNVFSNNTLDGLFFDLLSTGSIHGALISNNGGNGISAKRMEKPPFDDVHETALPLVVDSCTIQDNAGWGVFSGSESDAFDEGRGKVTISDSFIRRNLLGGVKASYASIANIAGSEIDNEGMGATSVGVWLDLRSTGVLDGDIIQGFGSHGVVIMRMVPPSPIANDPYVPARAEVRNSYIRNNGGDGVRLGEATLYGRGNAILVNDIIANNAGNGVQVQDESPENGGTSGQLVAVEIIHCTIVYNSGNGLYVHHLSSCWVSNTIIAFNGGYGVRVEYQSYVTLDDVVLYNNTSGNTYSIFPPGRIFYTAAGSMSVDPLLDATYHLTSTSPCIDAGSAIVGINPPGQQAPTDDIDGQPRVPPPDIGADEYQGPPPSLPAAVACADTLSEVMNSAIAAYVLDGGSASYLPTGSSNGEGAMALHSATPWQRIAPMTCNLKSSSIATCEDGPRLDAAVGSQQCRPETRNVLGLDATVIVQSANAAGTCLNLSAALDPSDPQRADFNSDLALVLGGVGGEGTLSACSAPERVAAITRLEGAGCNGATLFHFYRRDDGSGASDTFREKLRIKRFCNGESKGPTNVANPDDDPIRTTCPASDVSRSSVNCTVTDPSAPGFGTACHATPSAPGCTAGFVVAISQADPGMPDITMSIAKRVLADPNALGYAGRESVRTAPPGTGQRNRGANINGNTYGNSSVQQDKYLLSRRLWLHDTCIQQDVEIATCPGSPHCDSTGTSGPAPARDTAECRFFHWATDGFPAAYSANTGRENMDPILKQFGYIPCTEDHSEPSGNGNLCSKQNDPTYGYPPGVGGVTACVRDLPSGSTPCTAGEVCCSNGSACPGGGICPEPSPRSPGAPCSFNSDCASNNCDPFGADFGGICL